METVRSPFKTKKDALKGDVELSDREEFLNRKKRLFSQLGLSEDRDCPICLGEFSDKE
jgi:hypothetical protein